MSDRVQSRQPSPSAENETSNRAEKRAAVRVAAAKAARAKKRRQALLGSLGGLLAVALIAGAGVFLRNISEDRAGLGGGSSPSSAPADPDEPAGPTRPAQDAEFPPLPADADPALKTKPKAAPGTGDLTQLTVTPLVEGKGAPIRAGQSVTVNYVGALYKTGEEFDASWERREPFTFPLGGGRVIPGWDQGLVGVKIGSRVQLDLPSNLAYGDNPGNGAPPGPLRFVVDVLAAR